MKSTLLKIAFGVLLFIPVFVYWGTEPAMDVVANQPAAVAEMDLNVVPPNCRYGVADTGGADLLPQLGAGWVVNFLPSNNPSYAPGIEYMPMIRLKQARDGQGNRLPNYAFHLGTPPLHDGPGGMGQMIANNPGKLWIIGNEVDRHTYQDDLMPDIYAMAYHDFYHFIKQRDASARVAISALVEISPGRLQYLDFVWDAYLAKYGTAMPVDVWNMHVYALPERQQNGDDAAAAVALGTNPNLAIFDSGGQSALCSRNDVLCFAEHDDMAQLKYQIVAMRQWMKNRGQQDKPLIISEYSILYPYNTVGGVCEFLRDEYGNCFDPPRVAQFMVDSFEYLETAADPNLGYRLDNNKLVQQWLWFPSRVSNNEAVGSSSKLMTNNASVLTMVGNTFASSVAARPQNINLIVEQVNSPVANLTEPFSATVQLEVRIRNNGTTPTTQPTTVNFYNNSLLIGTAVIPAGLGGCAIHSETASFQWSGLGAGTYPYTVSLSNPQDSHAADNTGSGMVLVNPSQIWLPLTTTSSSKGMTIISPP